MRYRITANLVWDVECFSGKKEAFAIAEKQLKELLAASPFGAAVKGHVSLNHLKEKLTDLRLAEFSPDDVLPFITKKDSRREYKVGDKVYQVRMNSHRYHCFAQSRECAACKIVGTRMILERHTTASQPHFNLYAEENDKLIMMTKDHILPVTKGGEDRMENYQVLCCICNGLKGSAKLDLDGIRELRKIYNEMQVIGATSKKIHEAIHEARLRLGGVDPKLNIEERRVLLAKKKSEEPALITNSPINIYKTEEGEYRGKSNFETIGVKYEKIAELEAGFEFVPVRNNKRQVVVKWQDKDVSIYHGLLDYKIREMSPEKKAILEEAGWKFGDAKDFLGEDNGAKVAID